MGDMVWIANKLKQLDEVVLRREIQLLFQYPSEKRGEIDDELREMVIVAVMMLRQDLKKPAQIEMFIGALLRDVEPLFSAHHDRHTRLDVLWLMVDRPEIGIYLWRGDRYQTREGLKQAFDYGVHLPSLGLSQADHRTYDRALSLLIRRADANPDGVDDSKVSDWYPQLPQMVEEKIVDLFKADAQLETKYPNISISRPSVWLRFGPEDIDCFLEAVVAAYEHGYNASYSLAAMADTEEMVDYQESVDNCKTRRKQAADDALCSIIVSALLFFLSIATEIVLGLRIVTGAAILFSMFLLIRYGNRVVAHRKATGEFMTWARRTQRKWVNIFGTRSSYFKEIIDFDQDGQKARTGQAVFG